VNQRRNILDADRYDIRQVMILSAFVGVISCSSWPFVKKTLIVPSGSHRLSTKVENFVRKAQGDIILISGRVMTNERPCPHLVVTFEQQ